MITLHGITWNVEKPILGKISYFHTIKEERAVTFLVDPALSKDKLKGYAALIFSNINDEEKVKNIGIPIARIINCDIPLKEGDIAEILPSGKIIVLYQKHSDHNIIFVTSRCNSECIMCPQPIDYNEGNLTDMNLQLISLMDKSTNEIALTGGEPTVIGQDLFRLILACKYFLPSTSLLLLTNARRFNDFEYARFYSSLRHPKITVSVSLYGDNDIEHDFIVGSRGAFNETILGIINLASFGNPIEIRTVIHKYTYKNLLRISEYIYRNMPFVKHSVFMGLETFWRAKDNLDMLWVEPEEIITHLEKAIHYLAQRGMNVSIYNIPLCLLPNKLWSLARQSISEWKNIFDARCVDCTMKKQCCGMFNSAIHALNKYLKPIYHELSP